MERECESILSQPDKLGRLQSYKFYAEMQKCKIPYPTISLTDASRRRRACLLDKKLIGQKLILVLISERFSLPAATYLAPGCT